MATISGSGKYVQIQSGVLRIGSGSTIYTDVYATEYTNSGVTSRGIRADTLSYLGITGNSELSIGNARGYTGVIPVLTNFNVPYIANLHRPSEWTSQDTTVYNQWVQSITRQFINYRFVNGVMVGTA